jgi:hypothetical protein
MNITEPGAPAGDTCAVKVTVCPKIGEEGVALASVVVVETCAVRAPAHKNIPHTAETILDIAARITVSLFEKELSQLEPEGEHSCRWCVTTMRDYRTEVSPLQPTEFFDPTLDKIVPPWLRLPDNLA